ncbi:type II toxin-antitoxin system HipA family toxin [Variovorax sp. LT1R16]|uniref:type II toxin-antitoxin system HipA family toxin n=1 Tax=Variovorax sp. LT1R16 TaxID=3443728 RepID=UPI003F449DB9
MDIAVYADWTGLAAPLRLGWLHTRRGAGRDLFEFEFEAAALAHNATRNLHLDPRLGLFEGRQHPPQGHDTFGVFVDASPDRWGRLLMRRRLERAQRAGHVGKAIRLHESDYLLGVHDAYRSGALRLRLDDTGDFLDNQHGAAAPPFVQLRELEAASLSLERDEDNTAAAGDDWLRILIAPGGSLGGARPKASVVDPQDGLWIAKFPSVRDEHDVGAWELLVQTLAKGCGLAVPQSLARKFASPHHTYLVKRFDRTPSGRLHFASAMTLTGRADGDDASTGASYLEIARVLIDHGAHTIADLRELWSRIVFNMLVSNTDDHLRNHGFILVPGKGWRLSDAYDMNPVPDAQGLKLNVSEADNALDLDLVRSVAPYFRVSRKLGDEIVARSQAVVKQWPKIAASLKIRAREQEQMAAAFRLAG